MKWGELEVTDQVRVGGNGKGRKVEVMAEVGHGPRKEMEEP